MTKYVLLTDSDDGTALIRCVDEDEANGVASAAVFSDGGVSAWLVPTQALAVDNEKVKDLLRDGNSTYELHEKFRAQDYAHLETVPAGPLADLLDALLELVDEVGTKGPLTQRIIEAANTVGADVEDFEPIEVDQ